jgi:integrase
MSVLANVLTMPVPAQKKRVVRSRCAHLQAEQLKAFMTAAKAHGTREWAMFLFAFSHGARVSEICGLRWSDVNGKQMNVFSDAHTRSIRDAHASSTPSAVGTD